MKCRLGGPTPMWLTGGRRGEGGRGGGEGEGAREERKWVGEKGRDGVGEKGVGEGGSKEGKNREEGTCRVHMYM